MTYYLDLFTPETWKAFKDHGAKISGFREHQRKSAERVKPGDLFLCYLVRLSRWCGILQVKSTFFVDTAPIFLDPDPFVVRFRVEPKVVLEVDRSIPILSQKFGLVSHSQKESKCVHWVGRNMPICARPLDK